MRGSKGDCKMNQPSQTYTNHQIQCKPIIQRMIYICMRGLGEYREGKLNLRKTAIMINGGSVKGPRRDCEIFLLKFKSKNAKD